MTPVVSPGKSFSSLFWKSKKMGWDRIFPDTPKIASVSRGFQKRPAVILWGECYMWGRFSLFLSWPPNKHQIGRRGWTQFGSVTWKGRTKSTTSSPNGDFSYCIKQSILLGSLCSAGWCLEGDAPQSCARYCDQGGGLPSPMLGRGAHASWEQVPAWHSRAPGQVLTSLIISAWTVGEQCCSQAASPGLSLWVNRWTGKICL